MCYNFAGNLKYTTTKEAIQAHFAQCGEYSPVTAFTLQSHCSNICRPSTNRAPYDTEALGCEKADKQVQGFRFPGVQREEWPTASSETAPVSA